MISDEEYKKTLKQFHKLSDRHILAAETDMSSSIIQKVVKLSDKIRKAGNELIGLMRKNYNQLSLCVPRDIVNCLYYMALRKTRKNVNILVTSSMKCKSSMMLPGIFVENQ